MVRRLLSLVEREIRGLHEAAYLLAVFALLSQVLALVRDRALAHVFGAGPELDVYFAAFRIPDLVFAFLTIFVSGFALIPLISKRTEEERSALIGSVLFVFGISAIVVTSFVYVLAPFVIPRLVPGFGPEALQSTIALARIMLLQPILLGLSSIAAAVVQSSRRFMLFALAPIFYNVGIIFGILVLYPTMGLQGLAWGVVFGALMHFLIQSAPIIGLFRHGWSGRRVPLVALIRDVVVPSVPRSLALVGNQSLLIAYASIASLVSVGSVSAMSFAFNLQSVPLTVIGVSYAAALFPALSHLEAAGDRAGFNRELWTTVKHIAFWLLPATMFFIVLRAHIVRVVLGSGAFSWDDTRITAALLAIFGISLVAQALILAFSRAYYALGKTALPIILNLGGALFSGVVGYVLVVGVNNFSYLKYFVESLFRVEDVPGTLALMIPLSYSVVSIVVAILFAVLFARRYGYDRSVSASFGTSFSASVLGSTAAYAALYAFGPLLPTNTFLGIFTQGATAGLVGLVTWVIVLALMRSSELTDILAVLKTKLIRS